MVLVLLDTTVLLKIANQQFYQSFHLLMALVTSYITVYLI